MNVISLFYTFTLEDGRFGAAKPVYIYIYTAFNPFEKSSLNILLGAKAAAVNGLNSDHPPQHILAAALR